MDSQRVLAVWVTVLVSPANAQFVLHFFIEFFCNRIIEEGGHTGGKQNGRYYARHETDALYGHVRLYNRRAGHISESRKQQACESSAEAQPGFQGIYDTGKQKPVARRSLTYSIWSATSPIMAHNKGTVGA